MTHLDDLPEPPVRALAWTGDAARGHLSLLDQTLLPAEEVWNELRTVEDVEADILRLAVRGAPAIGVAAAFGLVLAARRLAADLEDPTSFEGRLREVAERLAATRPTAVNLRTAVRRSLRALEVAGFVPHDAPQVLLDAARDLETYEREACGAIARLGAGYLEGAERILTHCNAGALVTPGLGTALAPLYLLHHRGRRLHVWVDETRPLLQGLRLTAWELGRAGIAHAVVVDGAAAGLFRLGRVDAVITGADRICANGDVVNKVGTCGIAALAHLHGVPYYAAAPLTTLDPDTLTGDDVEIEERHGDTLRYLASGIASDTVETWEAAFDVTPARWVTAILTEAGAVEQPDAVGLAAFMARARCLQTGEAKGR